MKDKKTSVTIGIPAYYSEQNIGSLLTSLLEQNQRHIFIKQILVFVDGSKDKTIKQAKAVKSRKIKIFASKKNRGYAYALQFLMRKSNSGVFVGLNDDILIKSNNIIEDLVKPIIKDKKVGLVGGNIKALPPKTFVGKCIFTSYLVFETLRYNLQNGGTYLTCDGKILALSKDFAKNLSLTKTQVGNVDIFIYFQNLRKGLRYKFAKKAEVYYRLPETIADFRSQETRAANSRDLIKKQFSKFYKEYAFSKTAYLMSALKILLKYPLETIAFKLLINRGIKKQNKSVSTWKLALTTKKLSLLFVHSEEFNKFPY